VAYQILTGASEAIHIQRVLHEIDRIVRAPAAA
jgi:hypothetical protein